MYVVVEGIDGAGKSTLCRGLTESLGDMIVPHREPSDGPIGCVLRATFRTSSDPKLLSALFVADRMLELPAALDRAKDGQVVLSDRSFLSTLAYQGREDGAGFTVEELWLLHKYVVKPSMVIYIDCPPEIGMDRIRSRTEADSFETLEYLEATRKRYATAIDLMVADARKEGCKLEVFDLDGTDSIENIAAIAESLILSAVSARRSA